MRYKNFALTVALSIGLTLAASADIKVGGAFPDLATQKLEGKLPDSTKDKVVLIDFWASWCPPCAESFPVMDALQEKYGPQGLVVIAINVDEKKTDMEHFMKSHAVSFTVVRDPKQKLVEKAGVDTLPSSFLLGRDGKVVYKHSGFYGAETRKQYEHEIELLLKEAAK